MLLVDPEKEFSRLLNQNTADTLSTTVAFNAEGQVLNATRVSGSLKINLKSIASAGPVLLASQSKADVISLDPIEDIYGVPSVGTWQWLAEDGMGIWTTVNQDFALRPLQIIRFAVIGMAALLTAGTLLAGLWLWRNRLLAGRLQRAKAELDEMGQYQIIRKLGEGGMGAVYLATHRMMRRSTAVKIISARMTMRWRVSSVKSACAAT